MKSILNLVPNKIVRVLFSIVLILFAVCVCVYDYKTNPSRDVYADVEPTIQKLQEMSIVPQVVELVSNQEEPEPTGPLLSFEAGQTEEEVRMLLGDPSGCMTTTDRKVLIYSGKSLEFVDGKLIAPVEDVRGKVVDRRDDQAISLENELKVQLRKTGEWASDMVKKWDPRKHGIVLLDRSGKPSHNGYVAVINYGSLGSKGWATEIDYDPYMIETEIVLRKVDANDYFFMGAVVGPRVIQ